MDSSTASDEGKNFPHLTSSGTLHSEENVQPQQLNEMLGGLLYPAIDLATGACVLDVGREVGNWTRELAECYPQRQIVRVQTSTSAVQGAGKECKEWANVTYASVQDVFQLEDRFAPEAFDLICMHFCVGEVMLQHFPRLM
jgi:SAM-dependent methyltransferase